MKKNNIVSIVVVISLVFHLSLPIIALAEESENLNKQQVEKTVDTSSIVEALPKIKSTVVSEEPPTVEESRTVETTESSATESTVEQEQDENGYYEPSPESRSDLVEQSGIKSRSASTFLSPSAKLPATHFIDVSSHNGTISVANYNSMKAYGVKGVVVKLTEGVTYTNPFAQTQISNARAAGLVVSAYHFSQYTTEKQAIAEANYFAQKATSFGLDKTSLLVNDVESANSAINANANALVFRSQLHSQGFLNTALYASRSWFDSNLLKPESFGKKNIWVAQYPYAPTNSMNWNNDYASWQWSASMYFPGISHAFDVSVDYNGLFTTAAGSSNTVVDKYVTVINPNYNVWQDLELPPGEISGSKLNKTYHAKYGVTDDNGQKYYSIYDNQNQWIGYMKEKDVQVASGQQGIWQNVTKYVTATSNSYKIWENFNWKESSASGKSANTTYQVKGAYNHFNGSTYYSLYNSVNQWLGYINAADVSDGAGPQGAWLWADKYVAVISETDSIWSNFAWNQLISSKEVLNRTYQVSGRYNHFNGKTYYSLYDKDKQWQGYIDSASVKEVAPEGAWKSTNKYITIINGTYGILDNFSGKERAKSSTILNQTFQAKGYYEHFNGATYYSFYNKDKWQGYIDSRAVTESKPEGNWLPLTKYVTITSSSDSIWANFNWDELTPTKKVLNQTYKVTGHYKHFNGAIYYSIYNNSGQWQGYVSSSSVKDANGPEGVWLATDKYVTVSSDSDMIWKNFSWQTGTPSKSVLNRTFHVTGYYNHMNGSTYYTLYNGSNQWQGYIASSAVKEGAGAQGSWLGTTKYVTITASGYSIWNNFKWQERTSSNKVMNQTFKVNGSYNHLNGAVYYSLYDNTGNWQGYINSGGVTDASGPQGIWLPMNQEVIVDKNSYNSWGNFDWKALYSGNQLVNKTFKATGYYQHFNGSTYYSIFDGSGTWFGYINSKAVSMGGGVASFLATTRGKLVTELTSHEKDNFYLGTPYRSVSSSPDELRCMSPRGASNQYGPGMNCTGFVAVALKRSGADLNKIKQRTVGWGGLANAYNWRDALTPNVKYETFNSVSALLASGKAQKGDILYFEPDRTVPNYDCHIGFFWGDTASENKFWHSAPNENKISTIYSVSKIAKVYLFKL